MTRNLFLDFSLELQPCTTQPARYEDDSQSSCLLESGHMHGRTDLPCHVGIVQAPTSVEHFSSTTMARLFLLLTHPTCGAGECAYGRFSIAVPHVCANAI